MMSYVQYERDYAAAMRRQQLRNKRESLSHVVDYIDKYVGPDRRAVSYALTKQVMDMYGDKQIATYVEAAVRDLRQMYVMGLLDDCNIDECSSDSDYTVESSDST